ncbi:MAG: hypothetical protein QM764_04040 [Chitinophagaceae bacterium]
MPQPAKAPLIPSYFSISNLSYFVDRGSVRAAGFKRTSSNKYDNIKGRIAESLVKELFLVSDYNVFHYGMEYAVPQIMQELNHSSVAEQIRRMPDFVVQDKKTKDVHFVEVKYRSSGKFMYSDLPENYPYLDALIVVMSKKHIKCLSVTELREGKLITPVCKNYLGYRNEFKLKKTIIIEFCNLANRLFESI